MCTADQHMCSTNASKRTTSTDVDPKCLSKEKLVSVQFICKAEKATLTGLPIDGCNEGCRTAAGALQPTPKA